MPKIQRLDGSVINKIAAGEVIERPASVVKELLENSVDAGAGRIEVSVEKGGVELVRVSDDGCGMSMEDLPLSVASHATSKIRDADDLFCVSTLGFRGEALASIGEVSRMVVRSRTAESDAGGEMEVVAGKVSEIAPCGMGVGTTIEVRDLFVTTPVRRRFLRTTQTEMSHISEAVQRVALAQPGIHFELSHNGRSLFSLPRCERWVERIEQLFGEELVEQLIEVESRDEDYRLAGFVAHPSQSRSTSKMQYLICNGRHIRDRSLQHAMSEAYRGILMTGRFPICFLQFEMPAAAVDVNVHPTKLEVRFEDGRRLYSQLLGTLRTRFLTSDLTHRLDGPGAGQRGVAAFRPFDDQGRGVGAAAGTGFSVTREPDVQREMDASVLRPASGALEITTLSRDWDGARPRRDEDAEVDVGGDREEAPGTEKRPEEVELERRIGAGGALQIHDRYLISECEEGIVVIDQHALHERVIYEQLKEKVATGTVETQNLLVPEPVDLRGEEAATILEQREVLGQLGLKIEPFGGDTVIVAGVPAMFRRMKAGELVRQLAGELAEKQRSAATGDLLDEILHMMACKAAIKAGDRLAPEEIRALVEQQHLVRDTHHCPHGRPTSLVFSREELDRQFGRT